MSSPYSPGTPLGQTPSVFEPDGAWSFTPGQLGVFLYAVCVEEFRDGLLLGQSQRVQTLLVLDAFSPTLEPGQPGFLFCRPNPASHEITISLDVFSGEKVALNVWDTGGRLVFSENRHGGGPAVLPAAAWPSGWYTIQAKSDKRLSTGRVMKQ